MPVADIRAKSLELLDNAEDFVLGAVDDAFEAVNGFVPELNLPVVDRLPKASVIVDQAFGFASDVLASHRAFVGQLVAKAEALIEPAVEKTTSAT